MIPKAQRLPADIAALLDAAAAKRGIAPSLARAVAWIESRGNPRAVSQRGAMGIMQLMPDTAAELGVFDHFDAAENIDGGVRYLARLLGKYGHESGALAAYNWGPGNVDKAIEKALGQSPELPGQVDEYVRKVLARKSEEEGVRTSGTPFFGSSLLALRCPHCSHDIRVTVDLEIRR